MRRLIVLLGVFNFMCYIFTYNGTEGTHRYYYAQACCVAFSNLLGGFGWGNFLPSQNKEA